MKIKAMKCSLTLKASLSLLFFFSQIAFSQTTPSLLSNQSYTYSGAGNSGRPALSGGLPTITYDIPAGTNRVMVVTVGVERNHGTTTPNSNWPSNPDGTLSSATTRIFVSIGGLTTTNLGSGQSAAYRSTSGDNATVRLSTQYNAQYLSDADGLPIGPTAITFPNLTQPENAGDEMIVTIAVFENAHAVPQQVATNVSNSFASSGYTITAAAAGTPLVGTTASNILYLASAMLSQQGTALTISSGWSALHNLQVANTNGTTLPGSGASSYPDEQDGIRLASVTRTGLATAPSVTFTRSGTNNILSASGGIYAILPLARPELSGTVYRDNNGLTGGINNGGTGGGVWNTANSLWVNAVENGVVIATALVNTSGVFTFPQGGSLYEGSSVTFQLSNTQGTIGNAPPTKNLPIGWGTVGESTTSGPSDGTPNGEFTLTIGTTNSANATTNRFGVTTCAAGTVAPTVTNRSNTCPATTINLNTAHTGTIPSGSTLVWFTSNLTTGTQLTPAQIATTGAGVYYAFYYSASGNCYSPVSSGVIVSINSCCSADTNQVILNRNEIDNLPTN